MKYDYFEALCADINAQIEDNYASDPDFMNAYPEGQIGKLEEELWDMDEVTGNGKNGYCSKQQAWRHLFGNFDLLETAADELNSSYREIALDPVYADTTIRCYLLSDAIRTVIYRRFNLGI